MKSRFKQILAPIAIGLAAGTSALAQESFDLETHLRAIEASIPADAEVRAKVVNLYNLDGTRWMDAAFVHHTMPRLTPIRNHAFWSEGVATAGDYFSRFEFTRTGDWEYSLRFPMGDETRETAMHICGTSEDFICLQKRLGVHSGFTVNRVPGITGFEVHEHYQVTVRKTCRIEGKDEVEEESGSVGVVTRIEFGAPKSPSFSEMIADYYVKDTYMQALKTLQQEIVNGCTVEIVSLDTPTGLEQ